MRETRQAAAPTAARHTLLQDHRATVPAAAEATAEAAPAADTAVAEEAVAEEAVAEVPAEEEDKTIKTIIS